MRGADGSSEIWHPSSSELFVLWALADEARPDRTFVSLKHLARLTALHPRQVQRNIKAWQAAGLVDVSARYAASGRRSSNEYRLRLDKGARPMRPNSLVDNSVHKSSDFAGSATRVSGTPPAPIATPMSRLDPLFINRSEINLGTGGSAGAVDNPQNESAAPTGSMTPPEGGEKGSAGCEAPSTRERALAEIASMRGKAKV